MGERTRWRALARPAVALAAALGPILTAGAAAAQGSPLDARSAALEIEDVVVVSESVVGGPVLDEHGRPDYGPARWTGLWLLGIHLYGLQAPYHAVPTSPTGELAPAVEAVRAVAAPLCPERPLLEAAPVAGCARVLPGEAIAHLQYGHAGGSLAEVAIQVGDVGVELAVAPSRVAHAGCPGDTETGLLGLDLARREQRHTTLLAPSGRHCGPAPSR